MNISYGQAINQALTEEMKRNKKLMINFGVLLCQKMKIQKDL